MAHREATVSSEQAGVEVDVASAVQRRIAHDLHDGVSQLLVGAALMAKNLLEQAPPGMRPDIARLAELLDETMARVQSIARGLSPFHLGKLGVTAALRSVCAGVEANGAVKWSLEIDAASETLTEQTIVELCLIVQEAMRNAVRHGHAHSVDVRLVRYGAESVLSIADDGSGLKPDASSPGLGLESMSQRARRLGGSFEIGALARGGTLVRCVWPHGPSAESV
jgi:two-component system sensor histidine kinase UhpB